MIAFPLLAQHLPAPEGSAAQADGNGNFEQLLDTAKLPDLKALVATPPPPDGETGAEAETDPADDVAVPVGTEESDTPDPLVTVDRPLQQTVSKSADGLQDAPETEQPQPEESVKTPALKEPEPLPVEHEPATPSEPLLPDHDSISDVTRGKTVTEDAAFSAPDPATPHKAQVEVAAIQAESAPVEIVAVAPRNSVISAPASLDTNAQPDAAATEAQIFPLKAPAGDAPERPTPPDVAVPVTADAEPATDVSLHPQVDEAVLISAPAGPPQETPQQAQPVLPKQTVDLPPAPPAADVAGATKAAGRDIPPPANSEPRSAFAKNPEVLSVTRTGETVQPAPVRGEKPVADQTFAQRLAKTRMETAAPEGGSPRLQTTAEPTTVAPQPLRPVLAPAQAAPEQQATPPQQPIKSPIVRQVVDQLAHQPSEDGGATIRLKPHGMGVIEISVDRAKDGGLNVDMRVQNPLVLDAMRAERSAISHLFQPTGTTAGGSLSMDLFQSGAGTGREDTQRQNTPSEQNASGDNQGDAEAADDPALPARDRQTGALGAVNILT